MYCAGHVGCTHSNQLNDLKVKKVFTKTFTDKYKWSYHTVITVTCCCAKRKHKAGWKDSLEIPNQSFSCSFIQSEKDPNIYAQRMRKLGQYGPLRNTMRYMKANCVCVLLKI